MKTVLKGGEIICPHQNKVEVGDILMAEGKIKARGYNLKGDRTLDCRGLQIFPGFIDMHVHLREPGQIHKETIKSGMAAALAGGFTTVCAMANTNPPVDNQELLDQNIQRASESGGGIYYQVAACTRMLAGKELVDVENLRRRGACAFSDDGIPLMNIPLLEELLTMSEEMGFTIIQHAEHPDIPREDPLCEVKVIDRDLNIIARTGGRLHFAHISCAETAALIAAAKKDGVKVTAEVTPHHLVLARDMLTKLGSLGKMNPPLRLRSDVEALQAALVEGIIDAIASDHAPHTMAEKDMPFSKAPPGVVGLETTIGIIWEYFYHRRLLSPLSLSRLLAANPARILGLEPPSLFPGSSANLTVVDPVHEWEVDPQAFYSRGRNTPFYGMRLRGKAVMVFCKGVQVT